MKSAWAGMLALMAPLAGCGVSGDVSRGADGQDGVSVVVSGQETQSGDVRTEQRSVDLQGAESAVVDIEMGAGQLELSGGVEQGQLLDATFVYSEPEWRPEVDYQVEGTQGRLEIRQGDAGFNRSRMDERNEWTLRLSQGIPMDLRLGMGAGLSQLDLRGLDLGTLDLSKGAGQMRIDLSGDRPHDVTAAIEAGAGQISLTLPEAIGVRVEVRSVVGVINAPGFTRNGDIYTNAAFGTSPVTMEVTVRIGAGILSLELV
ncbi:MAG: toast rack family protein [Egibacteraceae bacterium]